MNDPQSILSQKVKMMDSSISFDVVLSFADVMNDLSCSKQEIARRFKLLVQQKETQLRKEITDTNTKNLKILQQKSLHFEEINKANRQLTEQLTKRNSQILSLNSQLASLQQDLLQLQTKYQQQQQRFRRFEQHTLGDYKRLQTIEIRYKQLLDEIQDEKNRKNQLQRRVDMMKNQKINWGDRINYLMQNRQKGLKEEYKEELHKLKDILLYYEQDNKLLKQQLANEKQTSTQSKQSYEFAIMTVQKKYGLSSVPKFVNTKIQTEQNSIKRIDVACEIAVQCAQCRKINDVARHFITKNVSVQTMKDPRKFAQNQTQTLFNFMQRDQEKFMIDNVKQVIEMGEKQKYIYQTKLNELYQILENQPSKMDDLKTITKLQSKILEKQRVIQLMKNDTLTLKSLNTILHSQLQALKNQMRQATQVRVDSLEFKKKSTTLRLFTQEYQHTPDKSKTQKGYEFTESKGLVSDQKRFSKTVDLNTTRKTFTHCKTRMNVLTPQINPRSSKQKLNNTFRTTDQETYRWQKFQQKLKNPELFSPSPYVNAVRRQKYKKFSLLKKKRHQQSEQMINFTVAF